MRISLMVLLQNQIISLTNKFTYNSPYHYKGQNMKNIKITDYRTVESFDALEYQQLEFIKYDEMARMYLVASSMKLTIFEKEQLRQNKVDSIEESKLIDILYKEILSLKQLNSYYNLPITIANFILSKFYFKLEI